MEQRRRWAIGQVVLSGHRQLVALQPRGLLLTLHVLHYPEAVRSCPAKFPATGSATTDEMKLAGLLLDTVSGPADWSSFQDVRAEERRTAKTDRSQNRRDTRRRGQLPRGPR